MNEETMRLLGLFYVPESIYLQKVLEYSFERKALRGRFLVPRTQSYSCQPIRYVTASQHLICLSQLAYVLLGFLARDNTPELSRMDYVTFQRLMAECKMWFREIRRLRFLKNVEKDTEFELTMALKEVRTPRMFAVCVIEIGGVLRGEMEFVAPLVC